ncbi:DUF5919 domain-containing protein [Mycobacterium syngnathidarum]
MESTDHNNTGDSKPAPVPNHVLRQAMRAKGVSNAKLAQAANVTTKTVERWLAGETEPYPANGRAAAEHLDHPPVLLWPAVFSASAVTNLGHAADAAADLPTADLSAVYLSRSEFLHANPPSTLFGAASDIAMSGVSLNLFCQHYPDTEIVRLLESGTTIRCLFLDPAGRHTADRETEEGHAPSVLSTLTTLNIRTLQRIQQRLPTEARPNLALRTYNEPIRFNITIIDSMTCIVAPYLPNARGVESPTLLINKRDDTPGLFDIFTTVFDHLWNRGRPITT